MSIDPAAKRDVSLRIARVKLGVALKKDVRQAPIASNDVTTQFCDSIEEVLRQNTPVNIQVAT